ncbi:2Fe-2S iron-sulfur cluster-binding protein [Paenibacillus agricola]|uniref:2Fe-2S iron-sulfur cluster binding domain-containing protein n=1 Tax=Paenibacillus agricola TaxID=2716264 RepID=A0ABX0IZU8_9BACL|nr:2Fe-2S iron-sulfur cluster-binding protein [Paenibacillus agricola]NHN28735.1 2Fe-2S iron-sulfur cluster binding domain-containing protein [Paenibacillus agricola]
MGVHITFLPDNKSIQVRPGMTILEASRKARVHIRTRCDGKAACLMCKVHVPDQTALAPMNQNERLKLGGMDEQGYRLACQAKAIADVTVMLPEDPLKAAIRKQLEAEREDDGLW